MQDPFGFAIEFLKDRASEYADFLRGVANFLSPKPLPLQNPYTPPFRGGQCLTSYNVNLDYTGTRYGSPFFFANQSTFTNVQGKITRLQENKNGNSVTSVTLYRTGSDGIEVAAGSTSPPDTDIWTAVSINRVIRVDRQNDDCGDLPNPSPNGTPSISGDGLFSPQNNKVENANGDLTEGAVVLAPALPLVFVAAILAGLVNALAAAKAAIDALTAIKAIADYLDSLKDLFEKLREFLNEWEKNRKKKKDIVRYTYGQLKGDGAIDLYPDNNSKYDGIQLDIVITKIPIGIGKYFGSFSPHRYIYDRLGYISFYSVNQGILSTHEIEFKRTSLEIPSLAVGFIYHLGLSEQIEGFAFATYSKEKA